MAIRATGRLIFALCLPAVLSACVEIVQESGYNFRQKDLKNEDIAGMSRREIFSYLGSPSVVSSVNEEKWYYISAVTGRKSIFAPKLKSQETLEIVFDTEGAAQSWKLYGKKDAHNVNFNDDKTYTAGHSVGVMEQLLGNVGRFSSDPGVVDE